MKSSAVLLAGAIAFDLGTMVVPVHAAVDSFIKFHNQSAPGEIKYNWIKLDRVNTAPACLSKGGQVVQHDGVQQCQMPNTHAATGHY